MVASFCNPRDMESDGLGVQSHLWLYRMVEASLGFMRPCLKKQTGERG